VKHKPFEEFKKLMEETFEVTNEWPKHIGNADHSDGALGTLIAVDIKLKPYGLEVVMYDTKSDFDAWEIIKRIELCSSCGLEDGWAVECPDCSEGPYW
jgi:hypothetical protein